MTNRMKGRSTLSRTNSCRMREQWLWQLGGCQQVASTSMKSQSWSLFISPNFRYLLVLKKVWTNKSVDRVVHGIFRLADQSLVSSLWKKTKSATSKRVSNGCRSSRLIKWSVETSRYLMLILRSNKPLKSMTMEK